MDEPATALSEDTRPLLDVLEDALPIKRQVNIEGWPRTPWIWRLEITQILELQRKRALATEGDRGAAEWGIELLTLCLGDEQAPGAFQSARGRSWLRRQAEAVTLLIRLAIEFNEISGPHPDRKKKFESATEQNASLPSPEQSA
jgi:hypothetical protein